MFESFMNWAGKQSGFSDAWGGGNWKDRFGTRDGIKPPTLPMPNIPTPNENNALSVLVNKATETIAATPEFIRHHGHNLEVGWKGLYEGIEYPGRTWQHWSDETTYFFSGGRPSGDDEDTDTSASSSTGDGGGGGGDGTTKASREEERARMDAIRRMLAGRYGRAETNLTGGSGYGEGKSRGLGGY